MAGPRQDDEDYWNTSVKKTLINFDQEEDVDSIEYVSKHSGGFSEGKHPVERGSEFEGVQSARYKASITQTLEAARGPAKYSGDYYGSLPKERFGSLQENNLGSSPSRQFPAATEAKLEARVQELERSLERAKSNRWTPLLVEHTIRDIIMGKPCTLELYRSKEDKLALIDTAIKLCDGNAILVAVLHLKRTVTSSIFIEVMTRRPEAINQYVVYLKQRKDYAELADVLGMMGKTEEAAMSAYEMAAKTQQTESKINNLKKCCRTHFEMEPSLSYESSMIQQQISMLERQQPIQKADASSRHKTDSPLPQLVGTPLITTLFYCCLYHYGIAENHLASPDGIRKAFGLTDKQFLWSAFTARAQLKQWQHVKEILLTKSQGWLGPSKLVITLNPEKSIEVLTKHGAPVEEYSRYIQLVDSLPQRLILAVKNNCHEIVVDTLVAMKDREQLEKYKAKLAPGSKEVMYATNALRASTVKWKN